MAATTTGSSTGARRFVGGQRGGERAARILNRDVGLTVVLQAVNQVVERRRARPAQTARPRPLEHPVGRARREHRAAGRAKPLFDDLAAAADITPRPSKKISNRARAAPRMSDVIRAAESAGVSSRSAVAFFPFRRHSRR